MMMGLAPVVAIAETLQVGELGIVVNVAERSKSGIKRFNKSQQELMEYQIAPRYMAAFLGDEAALASNVDLGNDKKVNAVAYSAATAYKYGSQGVLDASGIAHVGMNLLLGMDASNKKKFFLNSLASYGAGRIVLSKIFQVESLDLAVKAGVDELRASGFEKVCGMGWRQEKGTYVPDSYITAPVVCSKSGGQPLLIARTTEHYSSLKGIVDGGFEVSISIWAAGSSPDELSARNQSIGEIRAGMPQGWFVMTADLSEALPPQTFVVWKDGVERRYPLPKL